MRHTIRRRLRLSRRPLILAVLLSLIATSSALLTSSAQADEALMCHGHVVTIDGAVEGVMGRGPGLQNSHVRALVINGTAGRDVIRGTNGIDYIMGLGGDDIICGLRGGDFINAGDGDDTIRGGAGRDSISGSLGSDIVFPGWGRDLVISTDGFDTVHPGNGALTISERVRPIELIATAHAMGMPIVKGANVWWQ